MSEEKETIFIKIGTEALGAQGRPPKPEILRSVARQIALLKEGLGHDVLVVSSGAVGCGRGVVPQKEIEKIDDEILRKQVLAAHGQVPLMLAWNLALREFGFVSAQALVTKLGLVHEDGGKYARQLMMQTMAMPNSLLIANENDAVAIQELKFGDNDQLSGHIIEMLDLPGKQRLIILSNVDGVYADFMTRTPETKPIAHIYPGSAAPIIKIANKSKGGSGGMGSKLDVAYRMAARGVTVHIASINEKNVITRLVAEGEALGTTIHPVGARPQP